MTDHHPRRHTPPERTERSDDALASRELPVGELPEGAVPDVEPDPLYRALLAEVASAAPPPIDWAALNARLEAAAELPLSRLRGSARRSSRAEPAWWEYAARRARAALPLAVAASLAMFAYAQYHPVDAAAERAEVAAAFAADPLDAYSSAVTGGDAATHVTSLLLTTAADAASAATTSAR